jgi:hypothetical protein
MASIMKGWPLVGLVAVIAVVVGAVRFLMRVPLNEDGTDPQRFLKDNSHVGPGNDSSRLP